MTRILALAMVAGSVLSACATETPSADADPITQAIAGKRLVAERGDFIDVNTNGTLAGRVGPDQNLDLAGAWTIRDGQWCRTLTAPETLAGTSCQDATLNGDGTITIAGANGPITWTIQ